MSVHPHNALYSLFNKLAQTPCPTWAQYQSAPEDEQKRIRERWCALTHRWIGDGSQADEAFRLYIRACNELRQQGKLKIISGPARSMGDDEEYPGEAEERGLTPGGFNRGEAS